MIQRNRTVFTYPAEGPAQGLLIGSEIGEHGVVVENAIVFPGAPRQTLTAMIRAGLVEAMQAGYRVVTVCVPDLDPRGGAVAGLLARGGFSPYTETKDGTWWHRWIA